MITYLYIYIYFFSCQFVHMYVYMYINMYICMYMYICIYQFVHMYACFIYIYMTYVWKNGSQKFQPRRSTWPLEIQSVRDLSFLNRVFWRGHPTGEWILKLLRRTVFNFTLALGYRSRLDKLGGAFEPVESRM